MFSEASSTYPQAITLHKAARTASPTEMLTTSFGAFELDQAYDIQRHLIQLRVDEGERLIGMKMGLTAKAKMEQVGVHEPIYGHLTNAMELVSGRSLSHSAHCHPRVEPEIAFRLKGDLSGAVTRADASAAIESVGAALEVIDSRYKNFKFTLTDVVADNASSSRFVLPPVWNPWRDQDISNISMELIRNGTTEQSGSSFAILEDPVLSLVSLVKMLDAKGERLHQGMIVFAGAATAAIAVQPGDRIQMKAADWSTPDFTVSA